MDSPDISVVGEPLDGAAPLATGAKMARRPAARTRPGMDAERLMDARPVATLTPMPRHLLLVGALLLSLAPFAAADDAAHVCVFLDPVSVSIDPTRCVMGQPCVSHSDQGTYVHTFDGCLSALPCVPLDLLADRAHLGCPADDVRAPTLP